MGLECRGRAKHAWTGDLPLAAPRAGSGSRQGTVVQLGRRRISRPNNVLCGFGTACCNCALIGGVEWRQTCKFLIPFPKSDSFRSILEYVIPIYHARRINY
jgi:hypothetical protein